jgi:predicted nucleic-acid-binding Zn-ribbon protein
MWSGNKEVRSLTNNATEQYDQTKCATKRWFYGNRLNAPLENADSQMAPEFRLRTVVLLLLFVPLGGWLVRLMIQSGDNDPFGEPLIWMVLTLLLVWCFVYGYCTRLSRCPKCGKYALGEEGNYFINFLKTMISLSGSADYWETCRNCGYVEWHERPLE